MKNHNKVCVKCNINKNISEYRLSEYSKISGRKTSCRDCEIDIINEKFEENIKDFIELFEKKQSLKFLMWANDEVGSIAFFEDYAFDFKDILFDLLNRCEKGLIFKYTDWELSDPNLSYQTWISLYNEQK